MFSEQYIRASDASKYLGIKTDTFLRWINDHSIPHVRVPAGSGTRTTVLLLKSDLEQFIQNHVVIKSEPPLKRQPGRPMKVCIGRSKA